MTGRRSSPGGTRWPAGSSVKVIPIPRPVAVVEVDGALVGWVDVDDRAWLEPHECNIGYLVLPEHRGKGYASRAVQLLVQLLALEGRYSAATLLIHPDNARSLALAARLGFPRVPDLDGNPYFRVPVPSLEPTDGVVTIRRHDPADVELDLEAKDEEQIRWLWLPGQREQWEALSPDERRASAEGGLRENRDVFGYGPKWIFAADTVADRYVAYVDCDLANEHVPKGEANLSYAGHPSHRGRGHVAAAVRLVVEFLRGHTAAREAHVIVDARNEPSLRVARSVGAQEQERWIDDLGATMVRHVLPIERPA